jgi:nitrite reductase/ring-hydroxylating ferredoxin subunit/uncharacterized membrane protein
MLERTSRPLRGLSNGIARVMDAIYAALGRPGKLLQDFLNGSWLGHSLHAVLVDVVVGGATAALLLDLLRVIFDVDGLEVAATWVIGLAGLTALGAIVTGLTDYKDTAPDSSERDVTGLHGVTNILATVAVAVSLYLRLADAHDAAFWLLLVGYAVLTFGAYVGGHVVFKYGYMVNHNAFSRGKRAKDFTPVAALVDVAEATPTKVMFGSTALVVVRRGDAVHALKETCSHAGGPLSEGELKDGTITCPWHFSTFRLADGAVVHGPAGTRQPAYRARVAGGQIEIQGPQD